MKNNKIGKLGGIIRVIFKNQHGVPRLQKTILITKDGEIYFMDKRVDLKNLQMAIKDNLKDVERDFLRIKADRDADVGTLISLIDEVRLTGVRNYSIVTEKAEVL